VLNIGLFEHILIAGKEKIQAGRSREERARLEFVLQFIIYSLIIAVEIIIGNEIMRQWQGRFLDFLAARIILRIQKFRSQRVKRSALLHLVFCRVVDLVHRHVREPPFEIE
jgi:hypothetical protein